MESAELRLAHALSVDPGVSEETRKAALAVLEETKQQGDFWAEVAKSG